MYTGEVAQACDLCSHYKYQSGLGYATCLSNSGQNPCPPSAGVPAGISGGILSCQMCSSSPITGTPVCAGQAWEQEWFLQSGDSRGDVLLTAFARKKRDEAMRGEITELEVLASTADYACELGYSARDNASQLSRIFVGTDGSATFSLLEGVIDAILAPGNEPIASDLPDGVSPFGNGNSGLHPHYDDGQNQLFHFAPYMATVARGGRIGEWLSLLGNYVHEDWGILDTSIGASWQDENLAYAGMSLGADIWFGNIQSCQLGDVLREVLSSPVPVEIGGRSTIPDEYPWIALCRLLPDDSSCKPSVPYPSDYQRN